MIKKETFGLNPSPFVTKHNNNSSSTTETTKPKEDGDDGSDDETSNSNNSTVVVGGISSEMMQQLGKSLFDRDSVRGDDDYKNKGMKDDSSKIVVTNSPGNKIEQNDRDMIITYLNDNNKLDDSNDNDDAVRIDILGNSSIITDDVSSISQISKKNATSNAKNNNNTASFYYNNHKYNNTRKQHHQPEFNDYFDENHFTLSNSVNVMQKKKSSLNHHHHHHHQQQPSFNTNTTMHKKKKNNNKNCNSSTFLLYILLPSCVMLLLSGIILTLHRNITELQKEIISLKDENKRILYECSKSNNSSGIVNSNNPYFIAGYNAGSAGYVIMLLWRHYMIPMFWCFIFLCLGYYKKCISVRIVQSS